MDFQETNSYISETKQDKKIFSRYFWNHSTQHTSDMHHQYFSNLLYKLKIYAVNDCYKHISMHIDICNPESSLLLPKVLYITILHQRKGIDRHIYSNVYRIG